MRIKLIACVDENMGIGYKGKLLCALPRDQRFFKRMTIGNGRNLVLMGRKTFESLQKPLSHRFMFVVSSRKDFYLKMGTKRKFFNSEVYTYSDEPVNLILKTLKRQGFFEDLWIIGGQSIYEQALDFADDVYLTVVRNVFKNVDRRFPCHSEIMLCSVERWDDDRFYLSSLDSYKADKDNKYAMDFYHYARRGPRRLRYEV